ncbi:activator-dependent family glycosyltransferase [Nonomuraea sp. 10N515B]|uniref:activator-dependent family glycosyltransferase n=1 Tax=Nonomuraea sp. 10N515B TaxID=3457422 RepID=UPI003FCD2FB4
MTHPAFIQGVRILFTTYAEKTHFLGMVPLAWALKTAGHDVRVASQPELTDVITNTGLTAVPVGRDHTLHQFLKRTEELDGGDEERFDFTENDPAKLTWEYLSSGYSQVVPWWFRLVNDPMIRDLIAFCRSWRPDLVVWEPVTYAGPIAAAACGAVHARMMWSVDLFTRTRSHFLRVRPPGGRDLLAEWIGAKAGRFGEELTTGHFTIDNVPSSLRQDPAYGLDRGLDYLPMRYVPYNGVSVVPQWLRASPEKPRVALTLGVSSTERLDGYAISVQEQLDALADLDIDLVATVSEAERAGLARVPDNTRLVTFVPLNALAPTCSAIINHGGNGSYCTTLLHGVPQLIVPFFFDGKLRAQYLQDQGAGLTLSCAEATGAGIRERLVRLLDELSFQENATRLREEMLALPTPNDLVPEIERRVAELR